MREAVPNREVYGRTLVEIGEANPRVVAFEADIAKSTNSYRFGERFPDRFYNCGAAELNMVCMAAGAAAAGLVPFASTFVVFASMRACEGIRQSICYARRNVKLVATNAGVEICGDGPSHQGIEDLSIMRAMPNLTVLSPADNESTRQAIWAVHRLDGPAYVRLGRQRAEHVHGHRFKFRIGQMARVREGRDIALIATGHMVAKALEAARALSAQGVEARVLDCHTIKPLDRQSVVRAAEETGALVTAEDHSVIGGLGGAVAEVLAEEGLNAVLRRVGVADLFASSGRDPRKLLAHFGLDAAAIQARAWEALEHRDGRRA